MSFWIFRHFKPTRATYDLGSDMLVSGNPNLKEVCLTFDDGPHKGSMDEILACLRENHVRATFFVVGSQVDRQPSLVRQMLAEGHEVGNHTYTHKRLNQMSLTSARQELAACEASVWRATGAKMTLMRPPGMEFNNNVLSLARDMGYVTIHWNVVAADYVKIDPKIIIQRVLKQTSNGSVILLHDSPDTAKALPEILKALKSQGYSFVTTTQMLARLPRPVVVASNAFHIPQQQAQQVKEVVASKQKKVEKTTRVSKQKSGWQDKSVRKELVDAPVWDGPNLEKTGNQSPG